MKTKLIFLSFMLVIFIFVSFIAGSANTNNSDEILINNELITETQNVSIVDNVIKYKYDHYQFPTIEEIRSVKGEKASILLQDYAIPKEYLNNLSTKGLMTACYEYPYSISLLLYSTPVLAYELMKERTDVLIELFERNDMDKEVYNYYLNFNTKNMNKKDYKYFMGIELVDYVVADYEFLNKLEKGQRTRLLGYCWDEYGNRGSDFPVEGLLLIITRIMEIDCAGLKNIDLYDNIENFNREGMFCRPMSEGEWSEFCDLVDSLV